MSRYIDADALKEKFTSKWILDRIDQHPTANVVERKEFILVGGKCSYHFAEIDGHKNIVFTLYSAVTDITNIRIRLDKYNLAEVVSCKDCMFNHWHTTPNGEKYHICNLNQLAFSEHDDFYCAYGERREDAD